jgi:hypothetical protein
MSLVADRCELVLIRQCYWSRWFRNDDFQTLLGRTKLFDLIGKQNCFVGHFVYYRWVDCVYK